MKQKSGPDKAPAEQVLKNIRRQTRFHPDVSVAQPADRLNDPAILAPILVASSAAALSWD
jgi:hypothetical protein